MTDLREKARELAHTLDAISLETDRYEWAMEAMALALEWAAEQCDDRDGWRWWSEHEPSVSGTDAAYACGYMAELLLAEARRLRGEEK